MGQRLTDKTALVKLESDDLHMVVDVSDTTSSAEGTSKKVENKYVIQTDTITLADSDFHALNSTPITVVTNQGSGHIIIPLSCFIIVDYDTTATTDRITLYLAHDPTAPNFCFSVGSFMRNETTDMTYIMAPVGSITAKSSIDNLALKLYADASFHGSCDFTANLFITYRVLKIG